jgi:hypothetical protein
MLDLIFIDVIVLITCTALLAWKGRLSHSHPAVIYLIFHFLVVTCRVFAINTGAHTLFTDWGTFYLPVTTEEIRRALVLADVTLVGVTLGSLYGAIRGSRRISSKPPSTYRPISGTLLRLVSAGSILIGSWAVLSLATIPGVQQTGRASFAQEGALSSSYITVTFAWAGLGLLALIYYYGFRWWLVVPMSSYLVIAGLQGGLRFRFFIPVILLAQIALDRRQRRWPTGKATLVGVLLLLLFFPLKEVGSLVKDGAPTSEIVATIRTSIGDTLSGESGDQSIFDQSALTLTLADESGKFFLGRPYLNVITLPVPRFMWSGKPGLADHLEEISTPRRDMADLGMVTTLSGDAYLNFWYFGIAIVPFVLAAVLTRFYLIAYSVPYSSLARFSYLMVSCNLIQVYRDGLVALPLFVIVNMLPLTLLVALHLMTGVRVANRPDSGQLVRNKRTSGSDGTVTRRRPLRGSPVPSS